ncbi:uncharacterized protein QC763_504475 [Podospora pseudopauciseta]|uniref:Uncharacterized protein n=1 Tax=Podospora pseudopauciseta TaxID=2093780 RepID=A0ABR0H8K5_9PEZI|nr:hypothetical protein QC763_504475 [Podospora pseudopauciseta]
MSALHYSRISGGLRESEMEETYLYHKLEAMRTLNSKVTDLETCTSDGCLSLIAGLALAEGGMGDPTAAEAHINGLCTLIDMKRPEEWQHRFYGMLQRIILMAGSYIAASRDPFLESHIIETDDMTLCYPHPYFTKPTSTLLSTAQVQATNLSPFYLTSTPCLEACKADVEGEVLFNVLERLTSICFTPYDNNNSETTSLLLSDTESYIASLLFQPDPSSSSPSKASFHKDRHHKKSKRKGHPYSQAPPIYYPSSSRAWAAAGYLYTHLILSPLWTQTHQDETIDPDLLWHLLNTLREDITKTEAAIKIGAYSPELWIWAVVIAAYTVRVSLQRQQQQQQQDPMTTGLASVAEDIFSTTSSEVLSTSQTVIWHGLTYAESSDSSSSSQDGSGASSQSHDNPDRGPGIPSQPHTYIPPVSPPPKDHLRSLKLFFRQKIAVWSQTTRVADWEGAKQVLSRIVWPNQSAGQLTSYSERLDTVMKTIWYEACLRLQ